MLLLLVVALRRGILQKAPMERAWWTATLVLVAMHATDLPLFDSRLNILGWTLVGWFGCLQPGAGTDSTAKA